jgi:hypothetical protein
VIFEVGKDIPPSADVSVDMSAVGEDMYRKIKYNFSEDVLRLPMIETRYFYLLIYFLYFIFSRILLTILDLLI